jgi:hypothetical protein
VANEATGELMSATNELTDESTCTLKAERVEAVREEMRRRRDGGREVLVWEG